MEENRAQLRFIVKYLNDNNQQYIEPYLTYDEVPIVYNLYKTGHQLISSHRITSPTIDYYLGIFYLITKNKGSMLANMESSAECGNVSAMRFLGYYYANDPNNTSKMLKYYHMAISERDYISMHNLGCFYLDRFYACSVKSHIHVALKYFKMASKYDYVDSMINVGNISIKLGDLENAFKYWILAAYIDNTKYKYVKNRIILNIDELEKYCDKLVDTLVIKSHEIENINDENVINIIGKIIIDKKLIDA